MAKPSRNAPCPCGSGKKYKKCCNNKAGAQDQKNVLDQSLEPAFSIETDELDDLSNSVLDLIDAEQFNEAESVCRKLRDRYPDQVDGIERMAGLYEARGEKEKAAEYYFRTADFMRSHPGFDEESIQWALEKAKQLAP